MQLLLVLCTESQLQNNQKILEKEVQVREWEILCQSGIAGIERTIDLIL